MTVVGDGFPVGFTGTRLGLDDRQRNTLINLFLAISLDNGGNVAFHHGDCVGADAQAQRIASGFGWWLVVHPPTNPRLRAFTDNNLTYEPAPYHVRNQRIIDRTSILVAAPAGMVEEVRSGTWSTVRYARTLHRHICVVWPDGTLTVDGKVGAGVSR